MWERCDIEGYGPIISDYSSHFPAFWNPWGPCQKQRHITFAEPLYYLGVSEWTLVVVFAYEDLWGNHLCIPSNTTQCLKPSSWIVFNKNIGLARWLSGKESAWNAEDVGSIPESGRFPQDPLKWHPTPVFLPGKSHGQRSPAGHSS